MQANTPDNDPAPPSVRDPARRTPLVSVLYLTYNHEAFAVEAVHSVLEQTYPLLDIIILDDASLDGTADIISREVRRHRRRSDVRFFRNEENLGEFGNTRKGLSLAFGEFIVLFNGDDVMLPNLVERLTDAWLEHDVSLVTANARHIDEAGRELNRFYRNPMEPCDDSFETLVRHCGNAVCFGAAMGFERGLYDEFGWPPSHLGAEDMLMPFYAYLAKGARFIPEPLLKYRVTGRNASLTLQWERSANPVDRLIVWQEDRYLHLAHAFAMISEIGRLAKSDPARFADTELRIRPLLDDLVYERARQMVEARTELHELGVPVGRLRPDIAAAPPAFIESATTPLALHEPDEPAAAYAPAHRTEATIKLFVVVYNDAQLLEPFLKHYQRAGVTEFYIAAAAEFAALIKSYAVRYRIRLVENLDVADSMSGGTLAVTEMRHQHQRHDEWVVIVDLDEFIEFDETIEEIIAAAEEGGANVVRGIMHDRFAADGSLKDYEPGSDLAKTYPVRSRFIREVMGGCDHKGVLVKGDLRSIPRGGHHEFAGERVHSRVLEISHYKWNSTAMPRIEDAYRKLEELQVPWAVEYKRVIDHFVQYGRFAWETFGGNLIGE